MNEQTLGQQVKYIGIRDIKIHDVSIMGYIGYFIISRNINGLPLSYIEYKINNVTHEKQIQTIPEALQAK